MRKYISVLGRQIQEAGFAIWFIACIILYGMLNGTVQFWWFFDQTGLGRLMHATVPSLLAFFTAAYKEP